VQDSRFIESEHRGINMTRSIKGTALDPMNKKKEDIKGNWLYKYNPKCKIYKYHHGKIVAGNKEGFTPEGRQKLIDFFMCYPASYRKVISFILIQQFMTDKYTVIKEEDICRFSGIKEKDLHGVLYYLWKTVQLIRTNHDTYRVPGYIWNSDVLEEVKKLQKNSFWKPKPVLSISFQKFKKRQAKHIEARLEALKDNTSVDNTSVID